MLGSQLPCAHMVNLSPMWAPAMLAKNTLTLPKKRLIGFIDALVNRNSDRGAPSRGTDPTLIGRNGAIFGRPFDLGKTRVHQLAYAHSQF